MNALQPHTTSLLREHRFDTVKDLVPFLADTILQTLRSGILRKGRASWILPGGSTPTSLYRYLSTQDFPWEHVTAMPSDERWLPANDPQRNESLIRQCLLQNRASKLAFISYLDNSASQLEAISHARNAFEILGSPIDDVLLGMGQDGHIASLFPDCLSSLAALSSSNLNPCVFSQSPVAPLSRISLSLHALTSTDNLKIYFTGEPKWKVFAEQSRKNNDSHELPIQTLIHHYPGPIDIYWTP